jgi:hypothetical protein
MWKFLEKLFKKPKKSAVKQKQAGADEVRKFVKTNFIIPARQKGEKRVTFSARDVHQGMKLSSKYAFMCAAIDAKKFLEFAKVSLIKRDGQTQGETARWTFKV